jgi:hypothetical protein
MDTERSLDPGDAENAPSPGVQHSLENTANNSSTPSHEMNAHESLGADDTQALEEVSQNHGTPESASVDALPEVAASESTPAPESTVPRDGADHGAEHGADCLADRPASAAPTEDVAGAAATLPAAVAVEGSSHVQQLDKQDASVLSQGASASEVPTKDPHAPAAAVSQPTQGVLAVENPAYPVAMEQQLVPGHQLPSSAVTLAHVLSLDTYKRNSIAYLDDNTIVTSVGNSVVFLSLPLMTQRYLPGRDGGGIGGVAVNPSRTLLAVAEKCPTAAPNVYLYSYPGLEIVKVLRQGTERSYAALAFNDAGDMLATVGGYPDYLITLWDWQQEAILLRSKAFSQDVYSVRFSPYLQGSLTTSGMGHIRFWKMASTFTGLKLQVRTPLTRIAGYPTSDTTFLCQTSSLTRPLVRNG